MADIRKQVIEASKRSPITRPFYLRNDKDIIAEWWAELDRILQILTVRPIASLFTSLTIHFQTEFANERTLVLVSDTDHSIHGVSAQAVTPASHFTIPYNLLQQLHDLDKTSPRFHQRLRDLIHGEEYRNLFSKLQSKDLACLAEYLNDVRH